MKIIGIVAIADNYAIGRDGALPWHHSADLKFFKERTIGQAIVMGTKTWRSIGRPLPGRTNIVLSRSGSVDVPDGVLVLADKASAIAVAQNGGSDLFVIGGAEIFAVFASDIDEWFVTTVPDKVHGADTFMPRDFLDGFRAAESRDLGDGLVVTTYVRQK